MKIDNRKVNGRIMLDREDRLDTLYWIIYINGTAASWLGGIDAEGEQVTIPSHIAGSAIKASLQAYIPVFFMMAAHYSNGHRVLISPSYNISADTTKLVIDISEIMEGYYLEIALPTGNITVKQFK
uniref:Uncharacterized protein n=1 Tax=Siphoviridae sp. ctCUc43 TaxID=2825379 RepID=A0A8S5QK49_9CAUD|nr:MAG TPA: hypothetical protein [Siphoviridae sp. ctCUc43]